MGDVRLGYLLQLIDVPPIATVSPWQEHVAVVRCSYLVLPLSILFSLLLQIREGLKNLTHLGALRLKEGKVAKAQTADGDDKKKGTSPFNVYTVY